MGLYACQKIERLLNSKKTAHIDSEVILKDILNDKRNDSLFSERFELHGLKKTLHKRKRKESSTENEAHQTCKIGISALAKSIIRLDRT